MITNRDEDMLNWLSEFKLATTNQINSIFYNNISICNKRLLKLCKDKVVNRIKDPYSKQYIYYTKRPKSLLQLKHYYIRNDFYIKLIQLGCSINNCLVEKKFGSIIPDLYISFMYQNKQYTFFVEIERSEQKINVKKYNRFYVCEYEEFLTQEIPVIYITHKKIPLCNYCTVVVQENLCNIEDIFNTYS